MLGTNLPEWGCKPKPSKIPSPQLQPRHDRIQVDDLSVAAEGVVPVQVDVAPRRDDIFLISSRAFALPLASYFVSSRDRMAEL